MAAKCPSTSTNSTSVIFPNNATPHPLPLSTMHQPLRPNFCALSKRETHTGGHVKIGVRVGDRHMRGEVAIDGALLTPYLIDAACCACVCLSPSLPPTLYLPPPFSFRPPSLPCAFVSVCAVSPCLYPCLSLSRACVRVCRLCVCVCACVRLQAIQSISRAL